LNEALIAHWQEVVTHGQEIEKHIGVEQWQEQDHNFRHGAGEIEERQCQQKGALVNSLWAGRSVMEGLSLRH
jgi:hypothetical protein